MITEIYAAFNPAIYEINKNSGIYGVTLFLDRRRIDIDVEYFNDKAEVDIAKYARHYFVQEPLLTNESIQLNRLFVAEWGLMGRTNKVSIDLINKHYFINAVVQVGESPDLIHERGTFRTDFKRLKKYKGYELSVGCIGFYDSKKSQSTFVSERKAIGSPFLYRLVEFESPHFVYNVLDDFREIVIAAVINGSFTSRTIMPIDIVKCIPNNPFYVRWVNQKGGYDYWMFAGRQKFENKTENRKIFNPYFSDITNVNKTREIYDMECKESVVVGAENVSDEDFLPLRKLVYSPLIEWWDERRSKWIRLFVSDYDSAYDTRNSSHKIEITFDLPDIQLQF